MRAYLDGLAAGLEAIEAWEAQWPPMAMAPELELAPGQLEDTLAALVLRLRDHWPTFHPAYAGQMIKPPHPVAWLAYSLAMALNPNNHALDGGPATAALEKEAVASLAGLIGWQEHLGHLSSSGTLANLEALWVARQLAPGQSFAVSQQAHYTHTRMAEVLGVPVALLPTDGHGRMDLEALEARLAQGDVGLVVATLGTTATGVVDPIDRIAEIAKRHGVRLHVDACYGGFFKLLAQGEAPEVAPEPFAALALADSVSIDPHKHGLQPYGCGAILFRDPQVGQLYRHDSPYTYFSSPELHLGEISLECSRAGASAAALWATLQAFPLASERGLGPVLRACRQAALAMAQALEASPYFHLVQWPDLDVLAYVPLAGGHLASGLSAETQRVFQALMEDPAEPVYLATCRLPRALVEERAPWIEWDQEELVVLRSALIKPEHAQVVPVLMRRLEQEAWAPGLEEAARQGKLPRKALTGPLDEKAAFLNAVLWALKKADSGLRAELSKVKAMDWSEGLVRVHLEIASPAGVGGAWGLTALGLGAEGIRERKALMAEALPLIPADQVHDPRWSGLVEAEEGLEALASKMILERVGELWPRLMPSRLPFTVGLAGAPEEAFDLQGQRWVEDPALSDQA